MGRGLGSCAAGMVGAKRDRMTMESLAWLVAGTGGVAIGVIAGVQHRVTPTSIIAISIVVAVAAVIVSRVLPRAGDHV
jgi:lysozyme family protein